MRKGSLWVPSLLGMAMVAGALLMEGGPFRTARAAIPELRPGRDIVVQGEAVAPGDLTAFLDVTVKGQGATGSSAQAAAAAAEADVTKAVAAIGIPPKAVSAGPFHLAPTQGIGGTGGFVAVKTLRVPLLAKTTMGDVVDAAMAAGAQSASGVTYVAKPSDPKELQRLLILATRDARTNAQSAAQALGVRLGPPEKVTVVSEGARATPQGSPGWGVTVEVSFQF